MDKPNELIVLFDGSFDGLLTVVYNRFYERLRPDYIYPSGLVQQRIGADTAHVETDCEKSARVYDAIRKKISSDTLHTVYQAYLRDDLEIYTNIYRYILFGFKFRADTDRYMKEDFVLKVLEASKNVAKEAHFSREFMRFKETKDGVLYGEFGPVNNCLPIVANHFADRFNGLKWLIRDKKRNTAAVFDGENFILTDIPAEIPRTIEFSDDENDIIALWKMFHKTIANESRVNPKLQTQLLPKRYRQFMTEFKF